MFIAERSIMIDAPVARVFAYASDWKKWHQWFEGVSHFTPTTESTQGTGTRYAYKASVMGIRIPVEIEIHDYVENEGWNGVSTKGTPHKTRWRFDSIGNKTRFTYGLEGHLSIPVMGRWLDRFLLQSQWDKIIANSLVNLKTKLQAEDQQATSRSTGKNMAKNLLISMIGVLLLLFYGCNCDDEPLITSFVFEGLSPSEIGTINQLEQSIKVSVPAGTDLASLTPSIQVLNPECQTLSPPSGEPKDFTFPVYYEVINEIGSMKTYVVFIRINKAEATRFSDDTVAIQWSAGSDMPVPSGWSASVVQHDKIYVFGGATKDREHVDVLQIYDPVSDQWDLSKSTPLNLRYEHAACAVNGKIYTFGGAAEYPDQVNDNIKVYDPETDIWKDHGKMTFPRNAFSTVAYDGKIYLLGGVSNELSSTAAYNRKIHLLEGKSNELISGADILDLVEVYDPEANSWETLAPMPGPRAYFSACMANGKIYAIGGICKFPILGLTSILEYDPLSDTWEEKQPLSKGRYLPSTCVINGKIFCIGGNPTDLAANGSTAVEVYDPAKDSVYQAISMEFARYAASSAVIDGKIIILGGCNGPLYNTYCGKTEIGIPEFK